MLRFKASASSYLMLTEDELQFQQEGYGVAERRRILSQLARPGLLVTKHPDGTLGSEWSVAADGANPGYLVIGASGAGVMGLVDSTGQLATATYPFRPTTLTAPLETIPVPDDGTTRTVIAQIVSTNYEEGTLTFDGTTSVVGSGTDFTRYMGSAEGPLHGTYIRIDPDDNSTLGGGAGIGSVESNGLGAGVYEIESVEDATHLTLTEAPPSGSYAGIPFSVAGSYRSEAEVTDPSVHTRYAVLISLVDQTFTPDADTFVLADVVISGGTITVSDRRGMSLALPRNQVAPTLRPVPRLQLYPDYTMDGANFQPETAFVDGGDAKTIGSYTGLGASFNPETHMLAVVSQAGVAGVKTRRMDMRQIGASSPTMSSSVTVVASGFDPSLMAYTYMGTRKLVCFYVASSVLKMKASTDDGATWSSEVAVWTPASGYQIRDPFGVVLPSGQWYVMATHVDDGETDFDLRAVFSLDPEGQTWDTNSSAGYTLNTTEGAFHVSAAVDPTNGALWVAYERNVTSPQVRVTRYDVPPGLPDASGATVTCDLLREADAVAAGGGQLTPAITVTPDGQALVFYSLWVYSSYVALRCASVTAVRGSTGALRQDWSKNVLLATDSDAVLPTALSTPARHHLAVADIHGGYAVTSLALYGTTEVGYVWWVE